MNNNKVFNQIFPLGEKNDAFAQYFIGQSYLAPVSYNKELGTAIFNVTFEPGCRNNWHSHTGGQLLICTAGRGYYQEKGKPARELFPGDVVEIPVNMVHWHGAAPDSWFSHLAVECNGATNKNTWLDPVSDAEYAEATSSAVPSSIFGSEDPELAAIFNHFVFDESVKACSLDSKTINIVRLTSLIATQSVALYKKMLDRSLTDGLSPIEAKEIVYHAGAYVGFAKSYDFVAATNEVMIKRGIKLPLPKQGTVTPDSRFADGLAVQKSIFGDGIDQMRRNAPEGQIQFQDFLSDNCFGDYYTRSGLSLQQRELITFTAILSMGGAEPQVKAHIKGNLTVGTTKQQLIDVVTCLVPLIGYPRSLNAVACIDAVG